MSNIVKILTILFVCLSLFSCHSTSIIEKGVSPELKDITNEHQVDLSNISLVIQRHSDKKEWHINQPRSSQRFIPASTSKIPHTLIAIDAGIAEPNTPFSWDNTDRGLSSWNQDQTLALAYKRSTVWVYKMIAGQLGHTRMKQRLMDFEYGNTNIGSEEQLTQYWLEGPLKISANEQIIFLTKLIDQTLPINKSTYEVALPMMLNDSLDDRQLYAKTGLFRNKSENIKFTGWFVGWLNVNNESEKEIYTFALNIDLQDFKEHPKRKAIVIWAFKKLGLWL